MKTRQMDYRYVETQTQLEQLVEDLKGSKILAIDTEFLREKTYFAKLCLIQINNGQLKAIIDPLTVHDLKVLVPIMQDESCVKVFHAGSQDLDILYHSLGVMPTPIFDTQMAAALMGFPLQVGYGPLVHALCGVKLAKADSYTDWSRRPLSANQIKYALEDVVYLPQMYADMTEKLAQQGRSTWLEDDFKALANPAKYENDPWEAWHRVKRVASLSAPQLAVARELAAWREREAVRRNIPRKWVIPDEALVEVARKGPRSIDKLMEVRGLSSKLNTKAAREVIDAVKRGKDCDSKDYPKLPKRQSGEAHIVGAIEMLSAVVEKRAHENGVAVPVLASHDELAKLVRGHRDECEVMKGWRYEMVGRELADVLDGKLSLRIEQGEMKLTSI